jgi:phage baseplate assembly protein V
MSDLINSAAGEHGNDSRIYGVAVAEVLSNWDSLGLGRVQLRLPWMPDFQPWARVSVLSAGAERGTYFIPQVGEEVLVAFNQGDVREPYVIGSLWNSQDKPPANDAQSKRIIRTPAGHEVEFDDTFQSIIITDVSGHTITLDPDGIVLEAGLSKLKLGKDGTVTLEGTTISIKAKATAELKGASVEVSADASATLKGGGLCTVQGGLVKIN